MNTTVSSHLKLVKLESKDKLEVDFDLQVGELTPVDPLSDLLGELDSTEESHTDEIIDHDFQNNSQDLIAGPLHHSRSLLVTQTQELSNLELGQELEKRMAILKEAAQRLGYFQDDLHCYLNLKLD